MKPYKQTISNNKIIREFANETDSHELVWHRDKKHRIVTVLEGKGWEFQLDNQLPVKLKAGSKIFIPKETYHRILKGTSNLRIEIQEVQNENMLMEHLLEARVISLDKFVSQMVRSVFGSKTDISLRNEVQQEIERAIAPVLEKYNYIVQ